MRVGTTTLIPILLATAMLITACEGDAGPAGSNGATGPAGADGGTGANGLVVQAPLAAGGAACPTGGVQIDSGTDTNGDGVLDADEITATNNVCRPSDAHNFNRIASFPVCLREPSTSLN